MTSVQRILSGHNNLARQAALSASSVRASTAIERVRATRQGGGRVRLAGEYTGHEATRIELEIVDDSSGAPRASVPQFVGVGNGRLDITHVDAGATLQAFSFTLADLGIATETAALDVREVQIRAKTPGDVGNQIRISVAPALSRAPTSWSLLADWNTGTRTQAGAQWDFGGLPLNSKDELSKDSPRIAFGFDPQVYRPWRKLKDGQWQHGLSPELERSIPAGTPVWQVTGGYVVTITDGNITETFGDTSATPAQDEIISFHDLLQALQSSALVEVAGVIAADRGIGGQAAIDVPLRTQSWLLALGGSVKLDNVEVPASAPTQTVTVRCINADVIGSEVWKVSGAVSGVLPNAVTGIPYTESAIGFLVPHIEPDTQGGGDWSFTTRFANRADDEGEPSICLRPFRLGANAVPRTVTFEYRRKPPAECNCNELPPLRLSNECLGLVDTEGEMALDPAYKTRLEDVYAWREQFIRDNTELRPAGTTPGTPGTPGDPGTPGVPGYDYYTFSARVNGLISQQVDVFVESAGRYDTAGDAQVALDAANGGTIPATTAVGVPITVNGVSVVVTSIYGMTSSTVTDADVSRWSQSRVDKREVPDTPPTPGTPAQPGFPGEPYGVGYLAYKRDLDWMEASIDVLLPCLAQVYEEPAALSDWDDLWSEVKQDLAEIQSTKNDITKPADADNRYLDRYRATVDNILLSIGIIPKSNPSTGAGRCWEDRDESHWWVDTSGRYLPAFTNYPYISARRDKETGHAYSTKEFGFGLVVACPDRLKVGDQLTINIDRVDGVRPYREGDEAIIQTIGAQAAWLAGGIDGSDEQTWNVHASAVGGLPDYIIPTDGAAAPAWQHAGITAQMSLGGIPFQLGDRFTLAVEAGQYRWRQDGGTWSVPADIPTNGPAALPDGLLLHFDPGAAPSFALGDAYTYQVHQPWAASHVQNAHAPTWGWATDNASITIDLGSIQPIAAIALARYTLPDTASLTAQHSDDGNTWSNPIAIDVSRAVAVQFLTAQVRYIRVNISDAPGGSLGWIWAGQPLATNNHASRCQRRRRWAVARGSSINPASLYAGAGDAWQLDWQDCLLESDADALLDTVNHAQQSGEPLIIVPHYLHPEDASLVRCADDALDIIDIHEYQPDNAAHRLLSATLNLEPIYAA